MCKSEHHGGCAWRGQDTKRDEVNVSTPAFFSSPDHQDLRLGDSPNKALLLHGFPGTPAELRGVADVLVRHGWQVHAPLLPGFGQDIANLSRQHWQDWLWAAQDHWQELHAEAEQTLLLGYSMGGALALYLAATRPMEHVLLLAPFWRFPAWQVHLLPVVKHIKRQFKPFAEADFNDPKMRQQLARIVPDADLDDSSVQWRLREGMVLPTSAIDELRKLGQAAYKKASEVVSDTVVLQGFHDKTVRAHDTRLLTARLGGRLELHELNGDHDFISPHSEGYQELQTWLEHYLTRLSQSQQQVNADT